MDQALCYETSREIEGKCAAPMTYGFTFGNILANCSVPEGGRPFYNFTVLARNVFEIELKDLTVTSAGPGVESVDRSFFEYALQ